MLEKHDKFGVICALTTQLHVIASFPQPAVQIVCVILLNVIVACASFQQNSGHLSKWHDYSAT